MKLDLAPSWILTLGVSRPVLAVLIVVSCVAVSARATVHPAPITSTTDCIACHADKAKGKVVHPAVQMGCTTCHAVLNRKGVSYVEMQHGGAPTLCFECHQDKKAMPHMAAHPLTFDFPPQPGMLGPRYVACTACHDPHVTQFDHLLKKSESGDKDHNLCLGCHSNGANVPSGGSRHLALDSGCDTCHVLHKQGSPDAQEFIFQIAKSAPDLCTGCHDTSTTELQTAHRNLPFATANCTNCHDPHSSTRPDLEQKVIHSPYGDGQCESCHSTSSGKQLTFVRGGGTALCFGCHKNAQNKIRSASVQHAAVAFKNSCTECHNPHASRTAALIAPDPVHACLKCHESQKRLEHTAQVKHAPAFDIRKGCVVCHAPHGAEQPHLLYLPAGESCAVCHAEMKAKATVRKHVVIPGSKVAISQRYLQEIEKVSMHQAHTEGLPDPRNTKQTITCLTCHVPHGGEKALLITGNASTEKLCLECHSFKDL